MSTNHDFSKQARIIHRDLAGKITIKSTKKLNPQMLSLLYTPGVGTISSDIAKKPSLAGEFTIKHNTVAVISDGSAVLGLGNIGPLAALPVMEGKAMLFSELAHLNSFPIVLNTQDPDEIVSTIINIAPVFGAINLEDIASPKCFDIETQLQKELDIAVVHDDQHATAIAVMAGLHNALKLAKKDNKAKIVVAGAGAAGNGVVRLLNSANFNNITLLDSKGIISKSRGDLDKHKKALLKLTNPVALGGGIDKAIKNADVFIGLSNAGLLTSEHVRSMAERAIVFAMANPIPEIDPAEAKKAGAFVVATGRSDYPNQINNVLVFPGMFAGLLKHKKRYVTNRMKLAASYALANAIKEPKPDKIIPDVFDPLVVRKVSEAMNI